MEECFLRSGVPAPAPVVESTSPVTNVELVAHGVGIGVAPEASVRAALTQKRLVTLPVSPAIPAGPVSLIWREGPADPRVDALREALEYGGRSPSSPRRRRSRERT